ncbi:MAG: amidohydrolase, partial [Candidatus Aminicenantes bacterium]|nr:amidohydrolase [Candidatus Aminicenantes bacterium]
MLAQEAHPAGRGNLELDVVHDPLLAEAQPPVNPRPWVEFAFEIEYKKVERRIRSSDTGEAMTDRRLKALAALAAAGLAAGACGGGTGMADRILVNGKIWTGDPRRPEAEAVAFLGDKVVALGTTDDIRRAAAPSAETIDLGGRRALPGFIDSHVHFMNGGFSLLAVQLRDASSKEEFVARVAAKARSLPIGEWLQNGEWDHELFQPVELPRRDWIDAVTPDHPVCVNRLDGHMILANSLALKLAGVTKSTPAPPGGEILRDPATGEPTGILKDAAMDLVYSKIPPPTPEQNLRAAEAALAYAAEKGVTSVHDVSGEVGLDIYQRLLREGRLTTRVYFYVPVTEVDLAVKMGLQTGFGNDRLRFAGLKGFADGSLGSATALFDEPYADDPKTSGILVGQMYPEGVMERRIRDGDRAGLQAAIHAIGDRANALVLDIFAEVARSNGPRDRRFRIEHAQHLRPADFRRYAELGVIASVQPYH